MSFAKKNILGIAYTISFLLLPISLIIWVLNFRFLNITYIGNIGHLANEPDCYIKDCALGRRKKRKAIIVAPTKKTFFSFPKQTCCNEYLLDLLRQRFYIIKSPYLALLCKILRLIKFLDEEVKQYGQEYLVHSESYLINYKWDKPSTLSLPNSYLEKGRGALKLLGVPEDAPYVVFANRDSSYRRCEQFFSFRNTDINDYHLALKELVKEGYYCIRLGYHKSQSLNWNLLKGFEKKIIDYTQSPLSSGWLDLFLVAQSEMFLVGSTGLRELSTLFQIPTVLVGLVPMAHFPPRHCDLCLPKIYIDLTTGNEIPFKTALSTEMGCFIHDHEFQKHGIGLRKNSPEEILMAVREELRYLRDGNNTKSKLQSSFESLLPKSRMAARVSDFFLRKYEHLLRN